MHVDNQLKSKVNIIVILRCNRSIPKSLSRWAKIYKKLNKIKEIYNKIFLSLFPIDFPTTCKDSRFFLFSLIIFKHIGISECNTPHPSPSPKIGRGGNISVILSGCYVRSTVIPNLVQNRCICIVN